MRSETVVYNGIRFRRYPDSPRWADRTYFRPSGNEGKRGLGALHQEIWKAAHGPIPSGHHIHHQDGDSLNNAVENLVAIPEFDHLSLHGRRPATDAQREHLARIREFATYWHRSPAGRAWHVNHGKAVWQGREPRVFTCVMCAREYTSVKPSNTRFCSNACKSRWRRQSGIDNETRRCAYCGDPFVCNRFADIATCSRVCGQRCRRRS